MTAKDLQQIADSIRERARVDQMIPNVRPCLKLLGELVAKSLADNGLLATDLAEIRLMTDTRAAASTRGETFTEQETQEQFCRFMFSPWPHTSDDQLRQLANPCLLLLLAGGFAAETVAEALDLPKQIIHRVAEQCWDRTVCSWSVGAIVPRTLDAIEYLRSKLPRDTTGANEEAVQTLEINSSHLTAHAQNDLRLAEEDGTLHIGKYHWLLSAQQYVMMYLLIENQGRPVSHGKLQKAGIKDPVNQKYRLITKIPDLKKRMLAHRGFLTLEKAGSSRAR